MDRGSLISSRTTQLPHHNSPPTRLISLQSFLNLALFMLRQRVGWSSSSTSSKPLSLVLPGYCFTEREMGREMSSLRKHVSSLYLVRAVPSLHNEEQSSQLDWSSKPGKDKLISYLSYFLGPFTAENDSDSVNVQLWFTDLNNLVLNDPYSFLCGFRRNEGLSLFGKGNIIFFIAAGGIKFMRPETNEAGESS